MKTFQIEPPDNSAQLDFLHAPNTPCGYTVNLEATEEGLAIEVLRPHGEEASTWDIFEFAVPVSADCNPLPELVEALEAFVALDEGKLLHGPMLHDQARAVLAKVEGAAK